MIQVKETLWLVGREESACNWPASVGVIERDVEIRRERSGGTDLLYRLDACDFHLGDVNRRDYRRSRNSVVVDTGRALLVIPGELGYEAEREAVHVTSLVEMIALGKCRLCRDAALRNAGDRAQVFDVGREE